MSIVLAVHVQLEIEMCSASFHCLHVTSEILYLDYS